MASDSRSLFIASGKASVGSFRSLHAALVAALLVVPACRRAQDVGNGPYADVVATAVPAIERAVRLKFKTPPRLETRSKEQVRQFVLGEVQSPHAQQEIAGSEAAYKLLGMIPDTMHLQPFLVNLLSEQIVGYYDPKTKVLYVVTGSAKDLVQVTVTHELVHALQDQYVNLDSVQNATGDNDRQTAAQAVFEGQAVYVQLQVMLGSGNVAVTMPGGWDRVRQMIRDNQASMPIFAGAPLVMQETLIFPYLSGAEFIKTYTDREHGVPYQHMPVSTEQILHPATAYFGHEDMPLHVRFNAIPSITHVYDNDLGEFETRLFLYQHLDNQDDATRGAAGWAGDRYEVFRTATGEGIAWATAWDSRSDAADFYELARKVADLRTKGESGKGRVIRVTTSEIGGRPMVLYVDAPSAAVADAITLRAVQIQ